HPTFGPSCSNGKMKITALDRELAALRNGFEGTVGLDDLVDVDVAPAPRVTVDDLEGRAAAGEFRDIPAFPIEMLAVPARRAADDLAVDPQVDAGLGGMPAAADQEIDRLSFDSEGRRRQRPDAAVASEVRVDQPFPQE